MLTGENRESEKVDKGERIWLGAHLMQSIACLAGMQSRDRKGSILITGRHGSF
jgi:hypothetical protein